MDAPLTAAPTSPLARYTWATGPDGWLTVAGWERLAADLGALADALERTAHSLWETAADPAHRLGRARKLRDRAADCRARADRLRSQAVQP